MLPKYVYISTKLHDITFQKTVAAMGVSDITDFRADDDL
jgi:hypothetical protein